MDLTQLKLHPQQRCEVHNILTGIKKPELNGAFWTAMDMFNIEPEEWKLKLEAVDAIMEAHGVEKLIEDGKEIASYVNTGDTYSATVLYDHENEEFLVTSWGDFYEEWTSKNMIEIDCESVSKHVHAVSCSPHIDWDEWIENGETDDEPQIDIRLQVTEGGWQLHYGLSDFDQDHRGAWGSSSVGKSVSMKEAMEIAKDLIEQAAESADCCLTKTIKVYNDGN